MKLYDFDAMFDEKLSAYIAKNKGKYTENEWEDVIPKLYKAFGDTFIKSVGDTPNGFFAKLADAELVTAVKTCLKNGVAVSGFLCSEIEKRGSAKLLMPLLDGSEKEREFAVGLIGSDGLAVGKYMDIITDGACGQELKEKCLELLKEKADLVLEMAVENYKNGVQCGYMLEIMSRSVVPSDRVFDILIKEFRSDPENLALNADYLARYGDARALQYLLDKIEDENIGYIEYKELLLAIESLGGKYDARRDFSSDPNYLLLKSHEAQVADIFNTENK